MNLKISFVFPEFGSWRLRISYFYVLFIRSWKNRAQIVFWVFSAHLLCLKPRDISLIQTDVVLGHKVRITLSVKHQLIFAWWLPDWVRWRIHELAILCIKWFRTFWVLASIMILLDRRLCVRVLAQLINFRLKRHFWLMEGPLFRLLEQRVDASLLWLSIKLFRVTQLLHMFELFLLQYSLIYTVRSLWFNGILVSICASFNCPFVKALFLLVKLILLIALKQWIISL